MRSLEPRRGLTLDTGALIALEHNRKRMRDAIVRATLDRVRVTVPVAVIAEWWRGQSHHAERIVRGFEVEDMTFPLAKIVGEALGAVPGATVVDTIVMASAAQRGDVVYTSDFGDLDRLRAHFPSVLVLSV